LEDTLIDFEMLQWCWWCGVFFFKYLTYSIVMHSLGHMSTHVSQ
jgi:hypothetical protein